MGDKTKCRTLHSLTQFFSVKYKSPKIEPVQYPQVSTNSRYVFVIGGSVDGVISQAVARYDIKTDQWREDMPKLNQPRWRASACCLGQKVYVCGGKGDRMKRLNSIEVLHISDS